MMAAAVCLKLFFKLDPLWWFNFIGLHIRARSKWSKRTHRTVIDSNNKIPLYLLFKKNEIFLIFIRYLIRLKNKMKYNMLSISIKYNLLTNNMILNKNKTTFIIKAIFTNSNSMSGIGTYWDFKHPIWISAFQTKHYKSLTDSF